MSLDELSRQVRADLDLFEYPVKDWVVPVAGACNVAIVGGGQAGLAIAFGLRREHISRVLVLDENPAGEEGPWVTYARMITLRTLKFLTGPDLGFPALTFRRWHAAVHGEAAWDDLARIDKADWMRYLVWFRETLNIPVRNNIRVTRIEPVGGIWALRLDNGETVLTREVVLATGLDGAGARRVPDLDLPAGAWAHSADRIDFERLRGRRVAVIGGGASAYDNAATALEHGAARVDLLIRRAAVPMINPFRALESSGFWRGFADLDDAARWRFMRRLLSFPMPPPQDSVDRVTRHRNAFIHFGSPVREAAPGIRLRVPDGWIDTDFVITATGFAVDLHARPELAAIAGATATWADRYNPPNGFADTAMARHPFLGSGFELIEKQPGICPGLRRVRMFNGGAMVSTGPVATGLNGMPFGLPRLIAHISRDFLCDQAGDMLEGFETYDEPDAWEQIRGSAAP